MGTGAGTANAILDAIYNGTAYAGVTTLYASLNTANPGTTGANEGAVTRVNVSSAFGAASASGVASNAAITWTGLPAGTWTYVSLWDASTGGNFVRSMAMSPSRTTVSGDSLTIPSGSLTDSLT